MAKRTKRIKKSSPITRAMRHTKQKGTTGATAEIYKFLGGGKKK